MSAKYKSPSFLLPNELNTSANPANDTGINSLYSMEFNGSSDYIDVGNPTELQLTGAFSISLWIKTNSTGDNTIISKDDNTSNPRGFNIGIQDTYPGGYINIFDGTTVYGVYITSSDTNYVDLRDNNWHHITAVYTPSTSISFFVDGNFVKSNTTNIPASVNFVNNNLNIGRKPQSGGIKYFNGKIDEVAIFNRALSTTEISALYDGSGSNIRPSNLMATDLNPIAYYPLGEQAQMQGYLGNEASSEWQFPNGVLQDYVMDFDGTDNVNSEANISSVSSFTASIWINRDDSATQYIYGQWVDGTTASQSWVLQTVGGIVYFNVRDASLSVKSAISTTSLTTGIWYNIIAVWTGSNIKLYINNSLEDTTACSSMNNPSTAVKLAIGSSSNNVSPFNGKISNVVIWNSDQESNRDNIYNNGSPQTTYTVTPQNWWKLNADSVYTPSAPNYTTALDFDSSQSDYIDFGDSDDFSFGNSSTDSPFTISQWWYMDNESSFRGISKFQTSSVAEWRLNTITSGILKFTLYDNGTTDNIAQDSTANMSSYVNQWIHVVGTYDGSSQASGLKVYVNGEILPTTNGSTGNYQAMHNTSAPVYLGRLNNDYANGKISNTALFNSALTPSQVSTLFNFGTPETNISFDPIAWWKLDNTTTGIQDSSGNGHTGTNNGAAQVSSSVAVVPSWKIPSALPIPTINYTTALDFDPSGNKIDLNPKFNFDLTSVNTISVWVNLENYSTFNSILTNNGTGGGSTGTYTQLLVLTTGSVNNTFAFYTYKQGFSTPTANSGWRSNDIPRQEFENSWHHVMLVRDGQNVSWYYDGQPWGGGTITTTQTENVDVNCIGQGNASSGVLGKISNLAIWNSDQSSNVSNIYNSGQPQSSYTVTPDHLFTLDNLTTGINDVYSSSAGTATSGVTKVDSNVYVGNIPVNGVSTTLPSTALQQSDLQFDSPYSNYSLSFDGATYIDCTDNDMFSFGNGTTDSPFSVSFWTKLNSVTGTQPFLSKDTTSPNREWAISIFSDSSNGVRIFLKNQGGNDQQSIDSSTALTTGVWYHITTTYDGRGGSNAADGLNIYINGILDTPTNIAKATYTAMSNTTAPVYIGKYSTNEIDGQIDETAIFNTELTSAQVLEIYNNGRPKDLTTFSGTAPISWWRLGENAYFDNNSFIVPNSIVGAPNGTGAGTITTMISADAPGTYANGIGENLDILDRVGDAPLSTSNSQSYNMIPDDKSLYVPGYVGLQTDNIYSMSFNGTDEYIQGGNIGISGNATFSISYWAYWDGSSFSSDYPSVVGNSTFSVSNGFSTTWKDGRPALDFWSVRYRADNALLTQQWYHLVFTKTQGAVSTTSKIYVNGAEVNGSLEGTDTNPNITNSNLIIGRLNNVSTRYWNGKIDEVAIWDKALTAEQIKFDLYKPTSEGNNQTADIANNPNLPNPVAWYRMGD